MKPKSKPLDFVRVLAQLESPRDLSAFLEDLLTPGEIEDFEARWKAAKLLETGLTYREVATKTGLSTATVTRVARSLRLGQGYKKALVTNKQLEST